MAIESTGETIARGEEPQPESGVAPVAATPSAETTTHDAAPNGTVSGNGIREKDRLYSLGTDNARRNHDEEDGKRDKADKADKSGIALQHTQSHAREVWKFRMRPADDDEPE